MPAIVANDRRRAEPGHLLAVCERHELDELRIAGRLDALHQFRERKADPRNDGRPALDAAQAVHAVLERGERHQFVETKGLRLLHGAFDLHCPGTGLQQARGVARWVFLVSAELVEVAVAGDQRRRRGLFHRRKWARPGRQLLLAPGGARKCRRGSGSSQQFPAPLVHALRGDLRRQHSGRTSNQHLGFLGMTSRTEKYR